MSIVTSSAIPGMTLIQVRAALAAARKQWNTSSPQQPMFISRPVNDKISIGEFCTRFKYYHHWKRHTKSANCKGSDYCALARSDDDDSEEDDDPEDGPVQPSQLAPLPSSNPRKRARK